MIQQILLALVLSALTVIIHVEGAVRVVFPFCRLWKRRPDSLERARPVATLIRLVSGLLVLHLAVMAMWAFAYRVFGVLADFETCFYYSLMSYPTVGYGDVLPARPWRLLGPVQGTVGVLMLGVSTGIVVAAVQRLYANAPSTADGPPPAADR